MSEPDCSQQAYAEEQYDHDYRKMAAENAALRSRLVEIDEDSRHMAATLGHTLERLAAADALLREARDWGNARFAQDVDAFLAREEKP